MECYFCSLGQIATKLWSYLLPKNRGYLLPKNEEISEEEGPSNENQQTQDEIQEEILLKIIAFIIYFCIFGAALDIPLLSHKYHFSNNT